VFFTGAFRRPRRLKWTVGLLVFWTGVVAGYTGYMMLDDGMSGTGMQILQGIVLSIPVAGTWLASSIFGGDFPGDVIIGRMYFLHALLLPGLLAGLLIVQIGLRLRQKPIRWPGRRRAAGERVFPRFVMRQAGLFMLVFAVIALLGGMVQVNPVWLFGPARAADVSSLSQPAWYVMFLDGAVRLMPPWELTLPIGDGYTVPPIFWAAVVLPGLLFALPMAYPFLEARARRDRREYHALDRPRDVPARTALGAMAVTFYLVLTLAGAGDFISFSFNISTNALTWAGRIGLLLLPPLAYWITHRICLGLQQHDRQVLAHGVETGIIRRLPNGGFTEIHQPLAAPGPDGRTALAYAGRAVPKKMNHLGALAPAARGFLRPVEGPARGGPGVEAGDPHRRLGDAA
jgi:ubiquinol-cytochrome c reductase cytochrome b subunit